jgi:hypothetical protein
MSRTDIRYLTANEKALLKPIFGGTLPYNEIWVGQNSSKWGGRLNSITLGTVPNFALAIYNLDFSGTSYHHRAVFVHELTHVWQTYHGMSNIWCGIKLWMKYSDYNDSYAYDLADETLLTDFNMEQQASIVADYWLATQGQGPLHNKGTKTGLRDYMPFILQLFLSGPPRDLTKYANRADSRPL